MTALRLPSAVSKRLRWAGPPTIGLVVAVGLLCSLGIFAVIGQWVLPDPNEQRLGEAFSSPGRGHIFGTDLLGRDIAAGVAAGIFTSLLIGVAVAAGSAVIGTAVGIVSGFYGGATDSLLMRFVDLQLAVPPIVVLLAVATVLDPTMPTLILILVIISWVPYARLIRTRVLSERERAYVAASRLAGTRHPRLMVVHLLPGVMPIALVFATLQVGFVVLAEAALSFLGLGIDPPTISLGYLISQGRDTLADGWWISVFPGIALVLIVLAANLVGDALRSRMGVEVMEGER